MDPGQRQAVDLARRFYAGAGALDLKCVVTGRDEPQWHHLGEAVPRRWHYTNIIPLDGSLNQLLDKRRWRYLPSEITPNSLEEIGLSHYRHGRFAHGYACDRLTSFLMWSPRKGVPLNWEPDASRSLEFAAYALLQLHALSALPFAIDTLKRSIRPTLQSPLKVSRRAAARVVMEIESYYRNYGVLDDAVVCCDLADRLLRPDVTLSAERTRVMQHKGIALAAMGDNGRAALLLDRVKEELDAGARYTDGHANDALWRSRLALNSARPDLDLCRTLIRKVYRQHTSGQVGSWAFAETVWTDAEINYLAGRSADASELLLQGQTLFYGAGIVPTAMLPLKSTRQFKERYPRDLYVLPRTVRALAGFRRIARGIVELVEERLRNRRLAG